MREEEGDASITSQERDGAADVRVGGPEAPAVPQTLLLVDQEEAAFLAEKRALELAKLREEKKLLEVKVKDAEEEAAQKMKAAEEEAAFLAEKRILELEEQRLKLKLLKIKAAEAQ